MGTDPAEPPAEFLRTNDRPREVLERDAANSVFRAIRQDESALRGGVCVEPFPTEFQDGREIHGVANVRFNLKNAVDTNRLSHTEARRHRD